ncbi:hypothetical protein CCH79_00011582 [Gambusia affinis]|uniref:Uncharacterized protein n=1 Tax=Gambusia affinis TaxID=33528 RepID=A0A315VBK8_GAMAF|nr:hypothetical protein CCH79_00011582 [Gambusia affinis]
MMTRSLGSISVNHIRFLCTMVTTSPVALWSMKTGLCLQFTAIL